MIDDGGLQELRNQRAEERAAAAAEQEEAQRRFHAPIDAALRRQDERVAKAVKAFLEAAAAIRPTASVTVWYTVPGPRRLFRKPLPQSRYRTERFGHEVWTHSFLDGEFHRGTAVIVGLDGVVSIRGGSYPGSGVPVSMQPHVKLMSTERGCVRADSADGLPFYVSQEGTYLRLLNEFTGDESRRIARLIAGTTEWFVACLADYLDGSGASSSRGSN